jgi:myo-inositol-1(or 4)-monophosphatase
MTTDLQLLEDAAVQAGKLALKVRGEGLRIQSKPGGSPVTNGDFAANDLLRQILRPARPDYGWLSEEDTDGPERLSAGRVFVIDPIDGTAAYLKDRDFWSVSVAVVEDGRPIAGVVYAPSLDQLYGAAVGEGARLNGALITVSGCDTEAGCAMLGDAKMFAHDSWPAPWPEMRIESRNSVAYRMCLVASGEFDACLAPSRKQDWDLAAADLIVHEAGGIATDHLGRTFVYNGPNPRQPSLVCAGPALHPLLLARLSHIQLSEA